MLLTNEISIKRKIKEILLASRIEAALPKDRILELYLNEIYLGSGSYGVTAAATTYFNKSLDELTLGEAAFLAGLPQSPNRYNPTRHLQTATARRNWVLDRMLEDGMAPREEVTQAEAHPLEPKHRQEIEEVKAPYFAEEVRRELLARYGDKVVYGSGLSVRTSLDARLQTAADAALRAGLIRYERDHGGWRGPVDRIDPKGNWEARLAKVPVPAVAKDVGWQLAVVTRSDRDGAAIGFNGGATGHIPFSDMHWARPRRDNGSFGPRPCENSNDRAAVYEFQSVFDRFRPLQARWSAKIPQSHHPGLLLRCCPLRCLLCHRIPPFSTSSRIGFRSAWLALATRPSMLRFI